MSGTRQWWSIIVVISVLALIAICCTGIGGFLVGLEMGLTLAEKDLSQDQESGPWESPSNPREGPTPASPPVQPTQPGPVAPVAPGTTHANPVSFGQPAVDERGMEIAVLSVERNVQFQSPLPTPGNEFVAITLRLRHQGLTPEALLYDSGTNFQVVGEKGIVYPSPVLVATNNDLGAGQLLANQERIGKIVIEVGMGEQGLILGWDGGGGARWLSLQ